MKPITDYATMPFDEYVTSLKKSSPISTLTDEPEPNKSIVNKLLNVRGLYFKGHLAELYQHVIGDTYDYPFERYLVLENEQKERVIMYDNESMDHEIEVLCDGSDESVRAMVAEELRLNEDNVRISKGGTYTNPITYFSKFSESYELRSYAMYERKVHVEGAHIQMRNPHQYAESNQLDLMRVETTPGGYTFSKTLVVFKNFKDHQELIKQIMAFAHEAEYDHEKLHALIIEHKQELPEIIDHYGALKPCSEPFNPTVSEAGYTDDEVNAYFEHHFKRFEVISTVIQDFVPSFDQSKHNSLDVIYDVHTEVPNTLMKIAITHQKTAIHREEVYSFECSSLNEAMIALKNHFKEHGLPKNPHQVAILLKHFCEDMNPE